MRSTKALVSVLISSLALVLAAGCGDDDDDVVASGGKGGSSGGSGGSRAGAGGTGGRSGGATGTGSSSGGMGTSGGASTGGTSATGGATPSTGGTTSAGGSNGGQVNLGGTTAVLEGGSAGEAGVGGESGGSSGGADPVGGGGAGGEAGAESGGTTSSGGAAPSGGTGGGGTSSGGTSSGGTSSGGTSSSADYCRAKCATDADCKNSKGSWGYCEPSTHYCRGTVLCDSPTDCIPAATGWTVRCSAELACPNAADVCVTGPTDKFQLGFCASPKPMDADCGGTDRSGLTLKRFGTNQDVTVCANLTQGCNAGACGAKTCAADGECTPAKGGSSCDETNGFCECAADTDCGETGRTHCYTDTKRCGCSTDAECARPGTTRICNLKTRACESVVACQGQDTSVCTTYPKMVCE